MLEQTQEFTLDRENLKTLSSETRIEILKQLSSRNYTVSELSKKLNYSKSTLHEHINKLVDSGLVERADSGYAPKWVYYRLSKQGMKLFGRTNRIMIAIASFTALIAFVQLTLALFWFFPTTDFAPVDGMHSIAEYDILTETTEPLPADDSPIISFELLLYSATAFLAIGIITLLFVAFKSSKPRITL